MYIVFIFKFKFIYPFIKAYINAPINIAAQRANKMYGLDKSDILFIATLIQKNNKAMNLLQAYKFAVSESSLVNFAVGIGHYSQTVLFAVNPIAFVYAAVYIC